MDIFAAAFLGILQGLTEFLPVSSTGHLVVAEQWLGVSPQRFGLTFDAALHIGTLLAVAVYFWKDVAALARFSKDSVRLWGFIALGIVPAGIFGLLFENTVATIFRSQTMVVVGLLLGSAAFIVAEKWGRRQRDSSSVGVKDALAIGITQVLAFIPGISRSGITIAAGLGMQLRREDAARFSFLMAIPLFAAAGLKRLSGVEFSVLAANDILFFSAGMVAAAVSGYLVIAFLMRYLAQHSLMPFVWYRLGFAGLLLVSVIFPLVP